MKKHCHAFVGIDMSKKQLKDAETQANLDKWQEELARHVAYLPVLCEQAGVTEDELHQAIGIHFYVRSITRSGGIQ
jgi:translation initiation factor 2 alpha subunit (eIF-2alpha)